MTAARILTIDIETQPATAEIWSLWDQNVSIQQLVEPSSLLCFAAKWEHERKVMFFSEWDGGREGMLKAAHALLDEADYVVGWNSTGFDVKVLMGEFLRAEMPPPSPHRNVDLMRVAKRNFRLMSNKLDFYAQQLGVGAKVSNGGFALWQELRRPKSEASLVKARNLMRRYNIADVRLTEQLFHRMRPWVTGMNLPLFEEGSGKPSCTRCGGEVHSRGWAYTTSLKYRRYQCTSCKGWMRAKRSEPTSTLVSELQ